MKFYIPDPRTRIQMAFAITSTTMATGMGFIFLDSLLIDLSPTYANQNFGYQLVFWILLSVLGIESARQTYFNGKNWAIKLNPWCWPTALLAFFPIDFKFNTDVKIYGNILLFLLNIFMWITSYTLLKKLSAASPARL